ncbi:alpha-1,2-fucosyltransferase [Allorhizobium sp. NPDC080224]|uniref:alpha-1,2-fucosyltransferase n=1 Tax=Allorhizobium sp. NPDC080224 TaxID=3390547 RepID=UPI003CFF9A92
MFQFATGRAVAHRLNAELLLDVSAFTHYDLRRYELDSWAIRARPATRDELARAGVFAAPPTFVRRLMQAAGFGLPMNRFQEASFAYDPRILAVKDPAYLDGYFQSARYFADVAGLLREEFVLRAPVDDGNAEVRRKIRESGASAVSLHIRRGDYVTNAHTAQYHGVCSLDYYRRAVTHIAERCPAPRFFVFSDDLDWVRDNLHIDQEMVLVDANGPDSGAWDMALMMACRHHIIANSSFSWWGAWLNPHSDKIIVAPQQWFSAATHDTRDLVPGDWVRL